MTLAPPPRIMNKHVRPWETGTLTGPSQPSGGLIVRFIRRVAKALLKPLGITVAIAVYISIVAATPINDTAGQIAGIVLVAAPLLLPFVAKLIPFDGHTMLVATGIASLAVAVIAGFLSGTVSLNHADIQTLVAQGTAVFGAAQFVFQIFNQAPQLAKWVH